MVLIIVSLILTVFAAAALLAPLHRVVVPHWPAAVIEWIDAEGRLRLLPSDHNAGGESVPRSRPASAARVVFRDCPTEDCGPLLGYVAAVRRAAAAPQALPSAGYWQPPPDGACDVALSGANPHAEVRWLPCESIRRVVWPNRMSIWARLNLAIRRSLERAGVELPPAG